MKKSLHRKFTVLNGITGEENFKGIYIFAIILALYGAYILSSGTKTMVEATLMSFTFSIFNLLFFLLIMLNSYNTYKTFSKDFDSYIIRLKTKKNYLKEIISLLVSSNILLIVMFFLIFYTFLVFFQAGNIGLDISTVYKGIPDIVYVLFYLFRYVIYMISLSLIIILINYKYNFTSSLFVTICFSISLFLGITSLEVTNSFQLAPWSYFQVTRYGSFSLEITYSILYLLFFEVLIFYLYNVKKNTKVKNKYLFSNDISYFLHKHKLLLGLFLGTTILIPFLTYSPLLSVTENLNSMFLVNLNLNKYNILNVIYYILSLTMFVYLAVNLYTKDLMYSLDNIFLREKIISWSKMKLATIILLTILVKFISYILVVLTLSLRAGSVSFELTILIRDLAYTILLELLFLNSYVLYLRNYKIVSIIAGLVFLLAVSFGVVWFKGISSILIIVLVISLIFLHKRRPSKLIERVGMIR